MWGTVLAYIAMVVAQTKGRNIIEVLHGTEAAERAMTMWSSRESVPSDLSRLEELCPGYRSAHFNSFSNILHASSMVATLWLFIYSTTLLFFGFFKPKNFVYLPPLYYLPAWAGRFYFQKDIPVVIARGVTLRSFLAGEFCSVLAMISGNLVRNGTEIALTGILVAGWIACLITVGGIWPKPVPVKVKPKME